MDNDQNIKDEHLREIAGTVFAIEKDNKPFPIWTTHTLLYLEMGDIINETPDDKTLKGKINWEIDGKSLVVTKKGILMLYIIKPYEGKNVL